MTTKIANNKSNCANIVWNIIEVVSVMSTKPLKNNSIPKNMTNVPLRLSILFESKNSRKAGDYPGGMHGRKESIKITVGYRYSICRIIGMELMSITDYHSIFMLDNFF